MFVISSPLIRLDFFDTPWLSHFSHNGWSCQDFASALDETTVPWSNPFSHVKRSYFDSMIPDCPSLLPLCPRCRMWLKVSAGGSGLWTGDSGPVLGQHRSRSRGGDQRNVLTWTRGFIVISHDYLSAVWTIKVKATTWTKSINKL